MFVTELIFHTDYPLSPPKMKFSIPHAIIPNLPFRGRAGEPLPVADNMVQVALPGSLGWTVMNEVMILRCCSRETSGEG